MVPEVFGCMGRLMIAAAMPLPKPGSCWMETASPRLSCQALMAAFSSGRLESSSSTTVPGRRIIHDLIERPFAAAQVHRRAIDDDQVDRRLVASFFAWMR